VIRVSIDALLEKDALPWKLQSKRYMQVLNLNIWVIYNAKCNVITI
jgi:hypothetical protein